MGLIQEFKEFAVKGNVIDMAVGIIIGGAFGPIVTSLVNDIIMPPIGSLLAGVDFKELSLNLIEAKDGKAGVVIGYGKLLNALINFLIVAFSVFMLVKAMNKLKKQPAPAPAAPPEPTMDQKLLKEIRDLLSRK